MSFDGPIASLPAGRVQAAFGFEHRDAEIDDTPDPNSIASNLYNLTSATPTRGEDSVNEVFTEIEVPLLAGKPGAYAADRERLAAVHGLRLVRLRQHVQARRHVQPDRLVLRASHAGHVVPRPGALRAVPGADERFLEPGRRPVQQLWREGGHGGGQLRFRGARLRRSSRRAVSACSAKAEPRPASKPRPPTT